jgi:Pyruvate/2-oxoacid:ferredoxin oxidoreductase delta subunit
MAEKTLYEQLAELIGAGDSALVPEIFESLADENEARLLLAAAPPATLEELAERTGLPAEGIEPLLDPLFRKGLLFMSKKADATRYYRVRNWGQFHDSTAVMNDPPPEMLGLWKRFMDEEWTEFDKKIESMLPRPVLRVIPVNVSLDSASQVLAADDVRNIVDSARRLAVTKCSCRAIDGACGMALEVCIQIDKAADYAVERGTGRELTRDEALEMLEECEYDGMIHVAENRRGLGHVICNCCSDCCINWASVRTGLGKWVAPSRFRAVVHAEECSGCDLCRDRCFFDALSVVEESGKVAVHDEKCMGCGVCRVIPRSSVASSCAAARTSRAWASARPTGCSSTTETTWSSSSTSWRSGRSGAVPFPSTPA